MPAIVEAPKSQFCPQDSKRQKSPQSVYLAIALHEAPSFEHLAQAQTAAIAVRQAARLDALLSPRKRRQEQGSENGYDGDNDQQLNQCESAPELGTTNTFPYCHILSLGTEDEMPPVRVPSA
jgi:hypothetical protein